MHANDPRPRPSHSFEEHTGELKVHLVASTLTGVFEEAGRALAQLMGGEDRGSALDVVEIVVLRSSDREALLLDWLNEIILRSEVGHVLFGEFRIDDLSDRELTATVYGRRVGRLRNPVKAATFHELAVSESKSGYEAMVILDV